MRIKSDDIIAGQPVLAIRSLLQYSKNSSSTSGSTLTTIEEILKVDTQTAKKIFQDLCEEEYIVPITKRNSFDDEKIVRWHNTLKGNSLAQATARKPIKRQTAEQLVQKFLERVKSINDCDDYAHRVRKVIIFGSYLSDSPDLGDIDLAVELENRCPDQEEQNILEEIRRENALEAGKSFRTFFDELAWPYYEILSILKNRSPSLSIHDLKNEKILSQPISSKILFDATQKEESY